MGVVKNITFDTFPEQREDLGGLVTLFPKGRTPITAVVVRSDAEEPFRTIYRTTAGYYLSRSEIDSFNSPGQRQYKGRKADVCFHYDTSRLLEGIIIRADSEEPHTTLILLEDGRVVEDVECQYCPKLEEAELPQVTERVNPHIEGLSARLRKLKTPERARELHGIYKQLIPGRKGKIANGQYKDLVPENEMPVTEFDVDASAKQIVDKATFIEFVGYVADQMERYDHLRNHASRLRESYCNPMRVRLETVKIDPTMN